MKALDALLKNEYSKRAYAQLGLRNPGASLARGGTGHYRIPRLEEGGGYLVLSPYSGPQIPPAEWESLQYLQYPTDPDTHFAPLTSATGENILRGFWDFGKPDLDGIWTPNADLAPNLVNYVKSVEARYGRVQLIRQQPNSWRETRWGLHLDDNNRLNPDTNGWVVRLWLQLTDDPHSCLVLREDQFDKKHEVRVPLPRSTQVLIDSQRLYHGGYHEGPGVRYALITSFESSQHLEHWLQDHSPAVDAQKGP